LFIYYKKTHLQEHLNYTLLLDQFVIFLFAKCHIQKMYKKYRRISNEYNTICDVHEIFATYIYMATIEKDVLGRRSLL